MSNLKSIITRYPGQLIGLIIIILLMIFGSLWLAESNQVKISSQQTEIESEEEGGPEAEFPLEAKEFSQLALRDENGYIPPDGLAKAIAHMRLMRTSTDQTQDAGVEPGSWTWLGPGNIGGRIRAILIHPNDSNIMWVGGVSGGIWNTTDAGATWHPVNDFMANLGISSLAMQPGNPSILYAGTGEVYQGAGIFKSTDGGIIWNQIPSTANPNFNYVLRIAISPNGTVMLAATGSGIWRSGDAGSTWIRTLSDRWVWDVKFHPGNNDRAIAGEAMGAWYSDNGGVTWLRAFPSEEKNWGRTEVAFAPSDPNIVYASVDTNSGEIWGSDDCGENYTRISSGFNHLGGQGWYDNSIWVDPTNEKFLVVGGIDMWRSDDGGTTLERISGAHVDHHAIVEIPKFNGENITTVFSGNDGGIYRADNIYTIGIYDWQELNNSLGITQFYGAAGNPTSGVIVGGTQDNGHVRYPGGDTESWVVGEGDGGFAAADPGDVNYFYGEVQHLGLFRSSDGGISTQLINGACQEAGCTGDWKPAPFTISDCQVNHVSFISPFIMDPNNPDRLLAGGWLLWRTNDAKTPNTSTSGPTWTSIKPPTNDNSPISAISVASGNSDIIYVGHSNGEVYKTIDGSTPTPTWFRVDTNTPPLPDRYVTRITIDWDDPDIVYTTFGGFSADNIWRTSNSGNTWEDKTGSGLTGLPEIPVRTLVIHPANSDWLYAGTELGVFTSEDGGANWSLPQDGPANVSVHELFWMGTDLVAATHGRGVFQWKPQWLKLTVVPADSGYVLLDPTSLYICGKACWRYMVGSKVTLTPVPNPGHIFTGWSQDCTGFGPCTLVIESDTFVTGHFAHGVYMPLIMR